MPKLSVIVPVYNCEKYLKETLDSISSQTFRDLEIICVNDGSTDNSVKVIEEFAKQDDRIRIVNKENGGLSSARNAGLDVAQGKYVAFIDGDDLLDSNAFEIALENIEKVDIVCYGIKVFGDSCLEMRESDNEYYRVKYEGILDLNRKILLNTDVSSCNKIFKMDIINKYKIRYPHGLRYEDANFYWKYMSVSQKACFIDKYFYHYRRHSSSIMASTFKGSPYAIDHLHILKNLYDFWCKNNLLKANYMFFTKIFKEYTIFAYNYSDNDNKIKALDVAREYAKEFFGKKNPTTFIKYLKKGKYSNLLEKDLNFLQKIFSIKKVSILYSTDVYKKLTILGLEFRYKNKVDNLERMLLKQNEYIKNLLKEKCDSNHRINEQQFQLDKLNHINTIQTFGFYNGDDFVKSCSLGESFIRQLNNDDFYKLCNKYFAFRELKEFHPHEVSIYINACLNTNRIEKAQNLLNEYVNIFGLYEIWRFLPVAKFAKEQGITDENIEKAVFVFNKLEENRKNKLFEKLVEGKTIAVVGNGPSEIGKGKGAEIDSHDIVIRMNNYQTKGFKQDYGSKTDIWVRGAGGDDVLDYTSVSNYKACVWAVSHKNFMVHFDNLELLNRDLKNPNILIIDLPFDNLNSLKKESGITFPSTGLGFIYYMIKKCSAKQVDFYGFSFLEENFVGYATHYFNDRSEDEARQRSSCHSFNEEAEYLKKLVRG